MEISIGENWLNKKNSWAYSSSPIKLVRNKYCMRKLRAQEAKMKFIDI